MEMYAKGESRTLGNVGETLIEWAERRLGDLNPLILCLKVRQRIILLRNAAAV